MNEPNQKLLVVEDEEHLAAALKLNLELEGYRVEVAATVREAGQALLQMEFDAIVLDVMLPDVNGFEFCRRIRESGNYTPVIMLTARDSSDDRIQGLESGADDYLAKPFDLEELLARVRSLLRRQKWDRRTEVVSGEPETRISFGRAVVDFESHDVRVDGVQRHLTRLELELLHYFVSNPGRVLARNELLEQVWKLRNSSSGRTVDNFMSRLRKHFEVDPSQPKHFLSVRGAGYKFVR